MRKPAAFLTLVVVAVGSGFAGYWAAKRDVPLPATLRDVETIVMRALGEAPATASPSGPSSGTVIYYRHPDGEPIYSATPEKTTDGREFTAVPSSDDVSFDLPPEAAPPAADASGGERKLLYYRHPMGLPDTSPTPKKDSMGMDYIPVYDGEADDGSTVRVSPGKLQRTGVRTALATRKPIIRPVKAPGVIAPDERRISVISLRSEAFLEKVADITTGEVIEKGRPLVSFYSKEIAAAGALYATDLKGGGRTAATGSLQRLENLGVPSAAIAEIYRTRKVPISVTLTAPRNGVVLERMAVDGMMAEPGETLFRIADLSTVWVIADVPEYELGSVRVGDEATIRIRSLPGQEYAGKVGLIYPKIQSQTRTARLRIELPNPDGRLLSNMYAEVEIATGEGKAVVTVPDSAVIDTGNRQVVIVDKGDGRLEPRDVKIGARGEDVVEIMTGIAEGDRVVVAANFLIDAESNLKAALTALTPAEPAQ